ncbi:MAG: hypothetical protein ISN64_03710 [Rickettsia sp.]|nr:hypothetical protein [Rickettsia sp.]
MFKIFKLFKHLDILKKVIFFNSLLNNMVSIKDKLDKNQTNKLRVFIENILSQKSEELKFFYLVQDLEKFFSSENLYMFGTIDNFFSFIGNVMENVNVIDSVFSRCYYNCISLHEHLFAKQTVKIDYLKFKKEFIGKASYLLLSYKESLNVKNEEKIVIELWESLAKISNFCLDNHFVEIDRFFLVSIRLLKILLNIEIVSYNNFFNITFEKLNTSYNDLQLVVSSKTSEKASNNNSDLAFKPKIRIEYVARHIRKFIEEFYSHFQLIYKSFNEQDFQEKFLQRFNHSFQNKFDYNSYELQQPKQNINSYKIKLSFLKDQYKYKLIEKSKILQEALESYNSDLVSFVDLVEVLLLYSFNSLQNGFDASDSLKELLQFVMEPDDVSKYLIVHKKQIYKLSDLLDQNLASNIKDHFFFKIVQIHSQFLLASKFMISYLKYFNLHYFNNITDSKNELEYCELDLKMLQKFYCDGEDVNHYSNNIIDQIESLIDKVFDIEISRENFVNFSSTQSILNFQLFLNSSYGIFKVITGKYKLEGDSCFVAHRIFLKKNDIGYMDLMHNFVMLKMDFIFAKDVLNNQKQSNKNSEKVQKHDNNVGKYLIKPYDRILNQELKFIDLIELSKSYVFCNTSINQIKNQKEKFVRCDSNMNNRNTLIIGKSLVSNTELETKKIDQFDFERDIKKSSRDIKKSSSSKRSFPEISKNRLEQSIILKNCDIEEKKKNHQQISKQDLEYVSWKDDAQISNSKIDDEQQKFLQNDNKNLFLHYQDSQELYQNSKIFDDCAQIQIQSPIFLNNQTSKLKTELEKNDPDFVKKLEISQNVSKSKTQENRSSYFHYIEKQHFSCKNNFFFKKYLFITADLCNMLEALDHESEKIIRLDFIDDSRARFYLKSDQVIDIYINITSAVEFQYIWDDFSSILILNEEQQQAALCTIIGDLESEIL